MDVYPRLELPPLVDEATGRKYRMYWEEAGSQRWPDVRNCRWVVRYED